MLYNISHVMLFDISCGIYITPVMLYNMFHVMLFNMFHFMLYNMCHVMLYNRTEHVI